MIKKIGVFVGAGLATILAGAGIATSVFLPKALKAKEGLESFIANGGKYNSLKNKDKINIVTIGDSVSAGYVGYLKREERSYADFLAKSFKNAGRLGYYHNFAKSGQRLSDIKRDVFEDPYVMRQITGQKDKSGNKIKGTGADLITITIGANDIIAYLKLFRFPFDSPINNFLRNGKPNVEAKYIRPGELKDTLHDGVIRQKVDFHVGKESANKQWRKLMTESSSTRGEFSDLADKERTEIFGYNPGLSRDKIDSYREFVDSLKDIKNMLDGKSESLLNIDMDWYPKVFDLVKREMAVLVRDLHEANHNAQIIILGHAFPFGQLHDGVLNNKKPELNNSSLKENFDKLLDSMEEGAKTNIDGNDSKFVSFYKVDEFAKFQSSFKKIDVSNINEFKKSVIGNAMPNITDIHPSVLGYDMIGESLYDIFGKDAGIKNIEATRQNSYPAGTKDDPETLNVNEELWTRDDELLLPENNINIDEWVKRYMEAKSFHVISDIANLLKGPIGKITIPLMNELLSKEDNIKITNTTNRMMPKLKKIFKPGIFNRIGGEKTVVPLVSPLFKTVEEMGNAIGAVKKQLKEELKNNNVSAVEMFKLSQWGFYTLFQKLLKIKDEAEELLDNKIILSLLIEDV